MDRLISILVKEFKTVKFSEPQERSHLTFCRGRNIQPHFQNLLLTLSPETNLGLERKPEVRLESNK